MGLAFERAARLFQRALELGSHEPKHGARCASNTPKPWSAPDAHGTPRMLIVTLRFQPCRGSRIELKRKAAYHLMTAGYVDEGRGLLAEVLSAIGMRLPGSPRVGLLRALLSRARLSLRGLTLETARPVQTPDQARTLEALWTVVQGSAGTDSVRDGRHARPLPGARARRRLGAACRARALLRGLPRELLGDQPSSACRRAR